MFSRKVGPRFGARHCLPVPGRPCSPFHGAYFASLGLRPAGLAYFPLLGLGLLSFILNVRHLRWQRLLPWLGLALLSAYQVRAIPFLPCWLGRVGLESSRIFAWQSLGHLAKGVYGSISESLTPPAWHRSIRLIAGVLGVTCLVCAWPGWLQGPPYEPRRWALELPISLERGAATVKRWHQAGLLAPEAHGLHLSSDTANAFAWLCPEEKGVLDRRLTAAFLDAPDAPEDWTSACAPRGINHVIVYDADRSRLLAVLDQVLADPLHWPLLLLDGDLAIFGFRDPARVGTADPFQGWELDLNRLAFGSAAIKKAPEKKSNPGADRHPGWRCSCTSFGSRRRPWKWNSSQGPGGKRFGNLPRHGRRP